jgi:hypothetical protein
MVPYRPPDKVNWYSETVDKILEGFYALVTRMTAEVTNIPAAFEYRFITRNLPLSALL